MTVRSKFGSSSGGVATRSRPFVGVVPGITGPLCRPWEGVVGGIRHAQVVECSCDQTYDHAVSVKAGIVGASGYTGAELLRLLAGHPDVEVVVATADTKAGTAASELYPSLAAAYPDLVFVDAGPDELFAHQLDLVF